jgi:catechol 2,3-dioxygenase-like lactoylglutathione lyase family enzyme
MSLAGERWQMCPVLGLRDVRAALETFTKQLGFGVVAAFDGVDRAEGMIYAILARDGAELHLQIRRRPPWTAARESIERDVYLRVPDADALHAELVERGAEILEPPSDRPYGMRDFTVAAPEEYRISFGSALRG